MKRVTYLCTCLTLLFCSSCSEDFLKPKPLSVYEPEVTFSTEAGLRSVMAFCDRHLKLFITADNRDIYH